MFMGVITPPLLLAQMMGMSKETTARLVSTALLVAALITAPSPLWANPSGGTVVSGTANGTVPIVVEN